MKRGPAGKLVPPAVIAILLVVGIVTLAPVSEAQAPEVANLSLTIQGNPIMYSTQTLDLCSTVHLGSCPVSFSVNENFDEPVSIAFTTQNAMLSPGQDASISANPNPSTPTAALDFVFNYNGHSYTYPYAISGFPSVGSSTLLSIPIPVGALTAALGLPPLPITLTFSSIVTSNLEGTLAGLGFTDSQTISWSSLSNVRASLSFSGGVDIAVLDLNSFMSVQNWKIGLSAGITGFPSVSLFNATVTNLDIQSADPTAYTWYKVSIASSNGGSVYPAAGDEWYIAGYQLQLQGTPDSGYTFEDWVVNGQASSASQSYLYQIEAPSTIQAQFTPISSATGTSSIPGPSTPVSQGPSQGEILISVSVVIAAAIVGLAIWRRH